MLIKNGKYVHCSHCKHRHWEGEANAYVCDGCGCAISDRDDSLMLHIHHRDKPSEMLDFCTWRCVLGKLPELEGDSVFLPEIKHGQMGLLLEAMKGVCDAD